MMFNAEFVLLPGENQSYGGMLCVDLIPQSSWFRNVRSAVAPATWRALRNRVYVRAGNRCELCGSNSRLDAHERFSYDVPTCTQRLERLIAICQLCHLVSHFGLATLQGKDEIAIGHLERVRGWDDAQVEHHIDSAFHLWEQRNHIRWKIDLSIIANAGYALKADAG
jgi:hypothetical protein